MAAVWAVPLIQVAAPLPPAHSELSTTKLPLLRGTMPSRQISSPVLEPTSALAAEIVPGLPVVPLHQVAIPVLLLQPGQPTA